MSDLISRQAAIDVLDAFEVMIENGDSNPYSWARQRLIELSPAQPELIQNNTVHLCDSCQYTYVTCPSHGNDAVFGDGKGNDNICACNKYIPIYVQPEIIHCKECKHWMRAYLDISGKFGCNIMRDFTAPNDYCFKAERKEDG